MPLPQSHLRALYTEIVMRSGPGSTEAREFRQKLNDNLEFQNQAQIVGELYRQGVIPPRPATATSGHG